MAKDKKDKKVKKGTTTTKLVGGHKPPKKNQKSGIVRHIHILGRIACNALFITAKKDGNGYLFGGFAVWARDIGGDYVLSSA